MGDNNDDVDMDNTQDLEILVKGLESYCNSKEYYLEGLCDYLKHIPKNLVQDVIKETSILWESKHITLDMVECIIGIYPEVVGVEIEDSCDSFAYPLHYACMNRYCTNDVISFLIDMYPDALRHFAVIRDGVDAIWINDFYNNMKVSGLPLHYYLARSDKFIDMETVIELVKHYPESMTKACEYTKVMPIHIMLNKKVSINFGDIELYCKTKQLTIDGLQKRIDRIPNELFDDILQRFNMLHMVCSNANVTLEAVEYLLEHYDTNGASKAIETPNAIEKSSAYPLHFACKNKSCPDSVIQLLIERYPAALNHVSMMDNDGVQVTHVRKNPYPYPGRNPMTHIAGIPLHYYLSREENVYVHSVRRMVLNYPLSLLGSEAPMRHSCVLAPLNIFLMNPRIINSFEVAQFLIETNSHSIWTIGDADVGDSSLQIACSSHAVDPKVIELIINTSPALIRQRRSNVTGDTPIHTLIKNNEMPEAIAMEVLRLLIQKDPTLTRAMNGHEVGQHERTPPLNLAASMGKSQFCKILVNADKDSIRAGSSSSNALPLHMAAKGGHVDTVKYLFGVDPTALDTQYNGKLFFRAFGTRPLVKSMLEFQWLCHLKAKETKLLTVRDEVGQVPLHHALYDSNVLLGSIKLFLEASPDSLFIADNDGTLPFHVACGCGSAEIVEYLTDYFIASFGEERRSNMIKEDKWGNTPLHYACRGAKCDVIKVLLEKHQEHTTSISERNDDDKLPIQLLCDARRLGLFKKVDTESIEYTEALWLMLRHCPETIVNW